MFLPSRCLLVVSLLSPYVVNAYLRQPHVRRSLQLVRYLAQVKDGEYGEEESMETSSGTNGTVVTKEMFLRDMLADPVVKRKKNKRNYKVLDNRDSLPFSVCVSTPDPYTHPDLKRKNAKKVKKRADSVENSIASSLYSTTSKDDPKDETWLGEYQLDKHTTTGDLLQIGGAEYRVVKHRCLYKYAGGKSFVMVKKILQVKEVGRLQAEEYIKRQWKKSNSDPQAGLE